MLRVRLRRTRTGGGRKARKAGQPAFGPGTAILHPDVWGLGRASDRTQATLVLMPFENQEFLMQFAMLRYVCMGNPAAAILGQTGSGIGGAACNTTGAPALANTYMTTPRAYGILSIQKFEARDYHRWPGWPGPRLGELLLPGIHAGYASTQGGQDKKMEF